MNYQVPQVISVSPTGIVDTLLSNAQAVVYPDSVYRFRYAASDKHLAWLADSAIYVLDMAKKELKLLASGLTQEVGVTQVDIEDLRVDQDFVYFEKRFDYSFGGYYQLPLSGGATSELVLNTTETMSSWTVLSNGNIFGVTGSYFDPSGLYQFAPEGALLARHHEDSIMTAVYGRDSSLATYTRSTLYTSKLAAPAQFTKIYYGYISTFDLVQIEGDHLFLESAGSGLKHIYEPTKLCETIGTFWITNFLASDGHLYAVNATTEKLVHFVY